MRVHLVPIGVLLLPAAAAARASVPIPLGAPVVALSAGPSRLLAATSRDVVLLDLQGHQIRRFPMTAPATAVRRAPPPDPFAISAGVSGADDFDEPYDGDLDLEDAENVTGRWERTRPRTRGSPSVAGPASVVAVDQRFAWWGGADGLWRVDLDGAGVVQLLRGSANGVDALATSLDGTHVVVQSNGFLLRSRDGGMTFDRLFPIAGGIAEVTITSTGTVFVLDASGLRRVRPETSTPERIGLSTADAIAGCGPVTLAFTSGRLLVLDDTDQQPTRARTETVPVDSIRLACSKDGSLWTALGAHLWTSTDQGQSGLEQARLPAVTIHAVAATQDGVWLASAFGIWFEPVGEPHRSPHTQAGPRALGAQGTPSPSALVRSTPWWLFALPRVDLGFASARSNRQHDLRAFALLTFTFDRGPLRALERHGLLANLAARRNSPLLAPREGAFTGSDPDDSRAEEADALIRIQETSP